MIKQIASIMPYASIAVVIIFLIKESKDNYKYHKMLKEWKKTEVYKVFYPTKTFKQEIKEGLNNLNNHIAEHIIFYLVAIFIILSFFGLLYEIGHPHYCIGPTDVEVPPVW